jgi:hypothetical protein
MNPVLLANLIAQLGTVGLPLIAKLVDDFRAGRTATTVTPEDLTELNRLASQTAEDIYAKLGITPPPPKAPAEPPAPAEPTP